MKCAYFRNVILGMILLLTILNPIIAQETNSEEQISNREIVQWINNFEDSNSPERIMKGTTDDKTNIDCVGDFLIINSMMWLGTEPALKIKETINIKDIVRIEDSREVIGDYIFVDFIICSKQGSYKMDCKRYNEYSFTRCSFEEKWVDMQGCCSHSLRFKFLISKADEETQRVYNALKALMKNYGANPKFGSRF